MSYKTSELRREINRRYREKNKELLRIRNALYRAKNKEKIKISQAKYRKNNAASIAATRITNAARYADKKRIYQQQYRRENRDSLLAKQIIYNHTESVIKKRHLATKSLSDSYIRNNLCKRTNLLAKDIPQSLIEAKRLIIQIQRSIK